MSVREVIERDLSAAKPLFDQLGWNASDAGIIHSLENALNANGSTLDLVALALLLYGALQVAEGIGLRRLRRWGEYLTVVATAIFLPLEIYELTERITALQLAILLINIAAVIYLLISKRLFGIRGGYTAMIARRQHESLLEVERSAAAHSDATPTR